MFSKKDTLKEKAKRAKEVMDILGLKAEDKKQISAALAMEILGEEFEMQDKYGKAVFVKTQGIEVMQQVRSMLEEEGVLTKKIEKK
tara:strand:- start:183 stop:440 length:258 start_codon:yes stop_codon:yes gene_type:complete